MNPKY